jgi:hypothetical protein
MYRNIILTLVLIAAIVVAIELAPPPPAPPPPDNRAEREFAAARAVLERRIPELKLHGMTVAQALEEIHRQTGVPIEDNWTSLEEARDRHVDVELHDVALGDAVQFLLCLDRYELLFYPMAQAEFDVVNGTLMIGSSANFNRPPRTFPTGTMTLRAYDVRDLLTDSYWGYQDSGQLTKQGEDRLSAIANLVQNFAGMKNYQLLSGSHSNNEPSGSAFIGTFAGRLFVMQSAYGHIQVEKLLARLRASGRDHSVQ